MAVIDSGWDGAWSDSRVITNDDTADHLGHGTACIDLILQVAPACTVMPIRIFKDRLEGSPPELLAAIERAVRDEAQVISLSLCVMQRTAILALRSACAEAAAAGVVIVAAGANRGGAGYPAAFPSVIGVARWPGATSWREGYRYDATSACECAAAATHRQVRLAGGTVGTVHGSSFAASVVSGYVALLLAEQGAAAPATVRRLLAAHAAEVVEGDRAPTPDATHHPARDLAQHPARGPVP